MALRAPFLFACAVWLAGCPRMPDGPDAGDAGRLPDGAPIDAWRGTAPPLAPCTGDAFCADAPGVACLTNVPGGACTRRCAVDAECGAHGSCVANVCLWGCSSGTGECVAHAGACLAQSGGPSWCVPVCYPAGREPAGYPSCGVGLMCDPYTATCGTSLAPGADNGAPCRDSIECRGGQCFIETDFTNGEPTGFLDGMCGSLGVVPPQHAYDTATRLPQGSCPDGSAVMPGFASSFAGDLALCFATCTSDASCRSGYACTHLETSIGRSFVDGLCLPIDCTTAACPAASSCVSVTNPFLGHPVCGRAP